MHKTFLVGVSFLAFTAETITAEPIQLIPHKKEEVSEPSASLPLPQTVKGFWEGTPPQVIETYFQKLPLLLISPVLQTLRAEILKEKYPPLLQNPTYEKILFSTLLAIGQLRQVT